MGFSCGPASVALPFSEAFAHGKYERRTLPGRAAVAMPHAKAVRVRRPHADASE